MHGPHHARPGYELARAAGNTGLPRETGDLLARDMVRAGGTVATIRDADSVHWHLSAPIALDSAYESMRRDPEHRPVAVFTDQEGRIYTAGLTQLPEDTLPTSLQSAVTAIVTRDGVFQ